MRVTPWGAVRTVTGSMHLVEAAGLQLLLDCGLFQGRRAESYERNRGFPFPAPGIDAVLLSHAHLDHCGNLPTLVRAGFEGPIYCTPATADLAALVLRDSAKVQQQDARYANKIRARTGQSPVVPLYDDDDAERAIRRFTPVPYGRPLPLGRAHLTYLDAGHILGSAVTVLEAEGRTIVFSGDLGRPGAPIVRDSQIPPAADLLLIETTYGDRRHEPRAAAEEHLAAAVRDAVGRGGKVLVPALAVGRTQDVAYILRELMGSKRIPAVPVFIDSPMANDVTDIYRAHPDNFDGAMRDRLRRNPDPFGFKGLHYVREVEDSQALNQLHDPFVVIATSGMVESGRILHHLHQHIGDPQSLLLIVSFQAANTLGRRLADGDSPVNIFGEPYEVRLEIVVLDAFSAHADRDELLRWVARIPRVGQVICVHGEEQQSMAFAQHLREAGKAARIPSRGEPITV